HTDFFHRFITIMAISSIVVTAVYILRVVGVLLLGPVKNDHFAHLPDARWYEKVSVVTLIVAVAGIGLFPLWLSNTIQESLQPIIDKLMAAL
ncbi:MAG: hypothetical protein KBH01_07855, partial [Breznakibacter sp.]|nr:hypothetical protein [Breznakibacter sp.]